MPLTDQDCQSTPTSNSLTKLSDGGGLQLWLMPSGSRYWRLAYRIGGKQKVFALGAFPEMNLEAARGARDRVKDLLKHVQDLSEFEHVSSGKCNAALHCAAPTFSAIAREFYDTVLSKRLVDNSLLQVDWLMRLTERNIGPQPLTEITASRVWDVLREHEARGRHYSARRLKTFIGSVFRYAVATGRAASDPTPNLKGALMSHRSRPHPAILEPEAFGGLLRAIDGYEGQPTTLAALHLMALLFPRPGELRNAEWREFDRGRKVWSVPEERMKMRRPHLVPLSNQAIQILDQLHRITGYGPLVFPSIRTGQRPISNLTLNAALRAIGYTKDEMTPHGFRASASTLLNESGKWRPDVIERQLAHQDANAIRRAYSRGEYWNERVRMMQWWADYLDELRSFARAKAIAKKGRDWSPQNWAGGAK